MEHITERFIELCDLIAKDGKAIESSMRLAVTQLSSLEQKNIKLYAEAESSKAEIEKKNRHLIESLQIQKIEQANKQKALDKKEQELREKEQKLGSKQEKFLAELKVLNAQKEDLEAGMNQLDKEKAAVKIRMGKLLAIEI